MSKNYSSTISNNRKNEKNGYSMTSSTSEHVMQNGKGLISFLFGSDAGNYANKLILDSFQMNSPAIALFVIKHALDNDVKLNFDNVDSEGHTLLHWLVVYSPKIPHAKTLLFDILNFPGISKYINKQDKKGNTIAHTAMYVAEINNFNMDDVISMLIKKGVDLSIKNSEGVNVLLEEVPNHNTVNQIFAKKPQKEFKELKELSDDEAEKIAEKIAKFFKVPKTDEMDTVNFDRNTIEESVAEMKNKKEIENKNVSSTSTEISANNVSDILKIKMKMTDEEKEKMKKKEVKPVNFGGKLDSDSNSSQIVHDILNKINNNSSLNKIAQNFQKKNEKQIGAGNDNIIGKRQRISYSEQEQSNSLINFVSAKKQSLNYDKFNSKNKHTSSISTVSMTSSYNLHKKGGASESEKEYKKEKEYDSSSSTGSSTSTSTDTSTETSTKSSSTESAFVTVTSDGGELEKTENIDEMEENGLQELARFSNEESTKRHNESVKRIKELLKVDDILAKVYKAMLYRKIKEEKKELNNDEVSKELEKRASDEKLLKGFVDKLDKKEVENLKKIIKEKDTKATQPKEEKKTKESKKEDRSIKRFLQDLDEELNDNNLHSDSSNQM
jgi:hypothetical protein